MTDDHITALEDRFEELATVILGPRRTDFMGGGRVEEDGLAHKVDEVSAQLALATGAVERLSVAVGEIKLPIVRMAAVATAVAAPLSAIMIEIIRRI
jgi:hypothetical protein